jgi:hypothetical protein
VECAQFTIRTFIYFIHINLKFECQDPYFYISARRDYWAFARQRQREKELWAEDVADLHNADLGYKCAIALLEACDVLHKVSGVLFRLVPRVLQRSCNVSM